MNISSTQSNSHTPLDDRAKRVAELEELRERGLAKQWQQLLLESGGKMPMTKDEWLTRQRLLVEDDRRKHQDAVQNVPIFRGVSMLYRSKSQGSPSSILERKDSSTPQVTCGVDHSDESIDRVNSAFARSAASDLKTEQDNISLNLSNTITSRSETSKPKSPSHWVEKKSESPNEWVVISDHDDSASHTITRLSANQQEFDVDTSKCSISDDPSVAFSSESQNAVVGNNQTFVDDCSFSRLDSSMISMDSAYSHTAEKTTKNMDLLVIFGILTIEDKGSMGGLNNWSTPKSLLVTKILNKFSETLNEEGKKGGILCSLRSSPYAVSIEKDVSFVAPSNRPNVIRSLVKAVVPLILHSRGDNVDDIDTVRNTTFNVLAQALQKVM